MFSESSRASKGALRKSLESLKEAEKNSNEPDEDVSISHGERSTIVKRKEVKKTVRKERAYMLLEKLTSRGETSEVFDSIKTKISLTSVATINADFTGKLVRRLYLILMLRLLENRVFQKHKLSRNRRNMEVVVASLNEKKNGEGVKLGRGFCRRI